MDVSEQLSKARLELSTLKHDKADIEDTVKVEDACSQTSEVSTTDELVQTESWCSRDASCQTSVESAAKATQSGDPAHLAAFTGVAAWSSVRGSPPGCPICPEMKSENLKLRSLLGEHEAILAATRINERKMRETIGRLKGKIEELEKSLAAAESRLRQSNKAVQTTRPSARPSDSVNLEERWMTERLVVALGKAEKMTENLVRSQSSSPPRKRLEPLNWPPSTARAKSPMPKHLEALKALRVEAASLRERAGQLEKELADSREDARLARVDMSRKLASANAEFRRLNQAIESERNAKAGLMAEMNDTVEELRHTKQRANQQEAKIRALREELRAAREQVKEKDLAITNEETANTARKKEAEDEVVSKLKACQRELRSREALISDLRKEVSAKRCLLVEAEAKVNETDARVKTLKADLQRQSRLTEQLKKKAIENEEVLQTATRSESEAKEKEGRARSEVERLKRQLDATKTRLEKTHAKLNDLKREEAARADGAAMLFRARQEGTYGVAGRGERRRHLAWTNDAKPAGGDAAEQCISRRLNEQRYALLKTVFCSVSSKVKVNRHGPDAEADISELSSVVELSDAQAPSSRPSVEDSDLHMITLASVDSSEKENRKVPSDHGNSSLNRAIRESLALLELTAEEAAEFLRPLNSSAS
ncbi:hypothetical protein FOL47_010855 [Perkinsus chesapeaki]|uniref:Uncharacterized protein n=1 Tax=Perkinsus chesapeaki TaxID=330153 RepID=A0A7J6L006_PERCH|nr:hypothetical protein FOL47_010855 [Perkinsus chesapeaki]